MVANITVTNDHGATIRVAHILYSNTPGMEEHVTETRILKPGESLTFGVLKSSRLEVMQH